MRFITVLGIFFGIPAAFIFLHINNKVETEQTTPAPVSIVYYEDQHVDKCFFWTEEKDNQKTSEDPFVESNRNNIK
jgi:hypothetical protein